MKYGREGESNESNESNQSNWKSKENGVLLERLDAGVGQQMNLEIGFSLKEFAALITDARSGCALAVDLAQVAP